MKPTRIVSAHALLALLLSLFASACSNSHSPQAGDTATSWLRWCVDDADCAAPGRCLAHLCTLPCTPAGDPCAELAAEARCLAPDDSTPATCDMLCERDQDCAGLGSSYACAEGRCRSIGAVQLSAQTLSLQAEQDQENWGPAPPLVAWTGDRWRIAQVAWRLRSNSGGSSVRVMSEIHADGTLHEYAPPTVGELPNSPAVPRPDTLAGDATFVVAIEDRSMFWDPAPIRYRFVLPESERRPELVYPRAHLLALAQGRDWLVLSTDDSRELHLGRYDPHEEHWTVPERALGVVLADDEDAFIGLHGDDVLVIRTQLERRVSVASVSGLAAASTRDFQPELRWEEQDLSGLRTAETDGHFTWTVMGGGWLLPEWYEKIPMGLEGGFYTSRPLSASQQPSVVRVGEDGSFKNTLQLHLSRNEQANLQHATTLPERDAIAFCHTESSDPDTTGTRRTALLLSVFGAAGRRIAGPLPVTTSWEDIRACQLNWSGSALLVSWLEVQLDERAHLHARVLLSP